MITAVDHFAGLGWGVACERLGIREYGVELAASALRMRSANGLRTIYRDVWSGLRFPWLVPFHELYIASPPCQTFSIAGNGDGRKALEDVLAAIDDRLYEDPEALFGLTESLDPRTALVLAPLAHIFQHRPRLVALEQVPEVLPVWHAYAAVLRGLGYSVWVDVMRAEQYGVPQTRRRAILMARLDGKVEPPRPTHSRYYSTDPGRLDPGVERWVSMAEALGFGLLDRPSPTITGGGTETGGAEPIAKLSRYTESSSWVLRGNQRPSGGSEYHTRAVDAPAQTITSQAGLFRFEERPAALRSQYGVGGSSEERGERLVDEPASTITSKSGSMKWVARKAMGAGMVERHGDRPGRTLDQPAFTIRANAGGMEPGGFLLEGETEDAESVSHRLTHLEAATLQSFPASMQWPGNQGERFLAIGNAVPPLLAEAILAALLAPPAERDAWDSVFAEVAG